MRSLSSVGLALSLVFGCLLLALLAELYYLLWWKKRICTRDIENDSHITPSRELLHKFCLERPLFFSSTALNAHQVCSSTHTHAPQSLLNEEDELMRLQVLSGPPRFLFTIKEETKEDLEIEENISRNGSSGRSSNEVLFETPSLTPIASPPYYTPPLTPTYYKHHEFNPLFESSDEAEFCKLRSSPPPKFKFLQDAEDKLYRKKLMEKAINKSPSTSSLLLRDEENGSFITFIVAKDNHREKELNPYSNHNIQHYKNKFFTV